MKFDSTLVIRLFRYNVLRARGGSDLSQPYKSNSREYPQPPTLDWLMFLT
jgi:hypothetical protein